MSEWVDVEKTISEERADWEAGQAIIKDMIALLETEKESLTEKIKMAEEGLSESAQGTYRRERRIQGRSRGSRQ